MEQRVGSGTASEALPRYVSEFVPLDPETGGIDRVAPTLE